MTNVLERAAQASAEIALTNEFFDQMRAAAVEKWAADGSASPEKRERLHLMVQVIDGVRKALNSAVMSGKIERHAQEIDEAINSVL